MKPYYQRDGITIYCGECSQVMAGFEPQSFDLTVTSPPYDNLRDYEGYTFDFEPIAGQLWRVTKKGGVVVWVVGDQTVNGSETGTSFRQALGFMELGFRLHDTMIYHRLNVVPRDPKIPRYYQEFEYMLVLSRGKPVCNHIKIPCKKAGSHGGAYSRSPDGTLRIDRKVKNKQRRIKNTKIKGNIWTYAAVADDHPASFPEALARDHIISWSNPDDLVLDPMMGSGTTLKMAMELGRRAVGIDISEEYCKIAVDRLRQPSFWSIVEPEKETREQLELLGTTSA